jgi:hypothetical protein
VEEQALLADSLIKTNSLRTAHRCLVKTLSNNKTQAEDCLEAVELPLASAKRLVLVGNSNKTKPKDLEVVLALALVPSRAVSERATPLLHSPITIKVEGCSAKTSLLEAACSAALHNQVKEQQAYHSARTLNRHNLANSPALVLACSEVEMLNRARWPLVKTSKQTLVLELSHRQQVQAALAFTSKQQCSKLKQLCTV